MGLILESTKVFNELRNGSDFSLNPGVSTSVLKANVGERIKIVSKFRAFWEVLADITNGNEFTVTLISGSLHSLSNKFAQNFEDAGFRVGDTFDFIDKNAGPTTFPGQTITLVNGTYMEFTLAGGLGTGIFTNAEIQGTIELNTLNYNFNITASSSSQNFINDVFQLVQSYEFIGLTIVGGDVVGVPKSPLFWESGSSVARHTATVNTYQQVFEVETILTIPYYKEGQLTNLQQAINPEPFNIETQYFAEEIILGVGNNALTNRTFEINRLVNDSIGYFNENFNGGPRQYSIVSVAYEEKVSGDSRETPEITETTKVTVVMASNNTTMAATDPAVVSFSYLPTSEDYLSSGDDFNDTWNYDSLRGLLDGAVVAGTNIIKNLDLDVDNPNQITFTFDIEFSQAQQDIMFEDGNFILAIDNEDPALGVEVSNRLNLIIDVEPFTKNTDIDGLLAVIKDEVYYHNEVFIDGVTSGETDLQAWNESYIMRDIRFKLITDITLVEINRIFARVIAFNTITEEFFIVQEIEIPSLTAGIQTKSGKKIQKINQGSNRGFLIPTDSIFNKLQLKSDNFSNPDQFYNLQVGIMINWETWEALILADTVFFDDTKPNNNLNKKTSNYSELNDYEIRLSMLYQVKKNDIITDYHAIQDNGAVFDYDLDKNGSPKFTTTHVYKDANSVVLPLKLVKDEDNEVTVTNDDGTSKISPNDFNGQIRLEVFEQGNEKSIHIISSIDGVIAGDILKPLTGEILMNRSLVGGNFTSKCLVDGIQLGLKKYSISSEIQEETLFDPILSPNLGHHYDATGLVTNTDNSFGTVDALDRCSVWKNLKGGVDNLTDPATANWPVLDNVNKFLQYDGINDRLKALAVGLTMPRTVAFVGEGPPSITGRWFEFKSAPGGGNASVFANVNDMQMNAAGWSGGNKDIDSPIVANKFFAVVVHFVLGSSPRWFTQFYDDISNPILSIEKTIGDSDMSGANTISEIWSGNSFLGVPKECKLNEILIYDINLSDAEGEAVINFLVNKWG